MRSQWITEIQPLESFAFNCCKWQHIDNDHIRDALVNSLCNAVII